MQPDAEAIREDLRSSDAEIRRLALERVPELAPEAALPLLVGCLGDASWRVRKAAVEILVGAPASWPVAEALVGALSDGENPGRRNAAVEALVRCGGRVVEQVLEATASDDVDVRKLAVDTLAGIGDRLAVGRLLDMLDDPDPNVRATVADALGAIGGEGVAEALLRVATRPGDDRLVAFSALRALAQLEAPVSVSGLAPALADALLCPAAYAVLAASDDEGAVEELLKGIASASRSCREAAMHALIGRLGRLDPAGAERLRERIRDAASEQLVSDALMRLEAADLSTRRVLVQFLGLLEREETVLPILLAGRDEALAELCGATLEALGSRAEAALDAGWSDLDAEARRLACRTLERTGGARGEARLLAALEDVDVDVRATAALALGRRGCAEALPALVRRLAGVADLEDDPEAESEVAALGTALVELARRGAARHPDLPRRSVELLADRIQGAAPPVRLALASVLAQIGGAAQPEQVTRLLGDPVAGVRRAAVQALGRLAEGAPEEGLRRAVADEAPEVRTAAARALAAAGGAEALAQLESLARDGDARVRAAAVRALGACRSRPRDEHGARVLRLLEAALSDEGGVALAAVEALRQLGGLGAARAARRALQRQETELLQSAVACIGTHGDPEDLVELVPLVSHPHWAVRSEAIGFLAERGAVRAVPAILRRLENERDEFVRAVMLRALQRLDL